MSTNVTEGVRDKYAAVADSTLSSDHAGVRAVAEAPPASRSTRWRPD